MRVIGPAQLIVALGTIVLADEFGEHALPTLIVAAEIIAVVITRSPTPRLSHSSPNAARM